VNLYLDIETIPPTSGDHLSRIRADVKPPGQYKKADSIAQWMAENGATAAQEEFAKLSLDGLYGEVCVIGFAVDDGPLSTVAQEAGEKQLLETAFRLIDEAAIGMDGQPHQVVVVGHNIEWDMRFLMQRAIRHGVRVPRSMVRAFDSARDYTYDTMRVWAGYKGFVKCRDLARELLNDDSDDIDGSQVAAAWTQDPALVATHCIHDVRRVRDLYKKFNEVIL
jgi:3'-5' exonuclease